jgi:hypothetical protein
MTRAGALDRRPTSPVLALPGCRTTATAPSSAPACQRRDERRERLLADLRVVDAQFRR